VPNNSLLYCSEKCKREDGLSSSPSLPNSPTTSTHTSSMKIFSFEPSRKDQWGITPSPTAAAMILSSPPRTSTTVRTITYRSSFSRPLPPLHPRTTGDSPRSVELVLPVYREPSTPVDRKSKSLDYGRRMVEENTAQTGGLNELFHFKELQTNPAN
jgi:hypothetical protein